MSPFPNPATAAGMDGGAGAGLGKGDILETLRRAPHYLLTNTALHKLDNFHDRNNTDR